MSERESWRANYVPAPNYYNLNHACVLINKALGGSFGCYLVGSAIRKRDFRDVDVRYIMKDDHFDVLFQNDHGYTNPFWSLLCVSISEWLSKATDLQIDFQIQRQSYANKNWPRSDGHERQALGIFIDYPGTRPTDVGDEEKPG